MNPARRIKQTSDQSARGVTKGSAVTDLGPDLAAFAYNVASLGAVVIPCHLHQQ